MRPIILLLLGTGCASQHDYYVEGALLPTVQQLAPGDRERTAVPAQRAESHAAVFVRASTVRAWPATSSEPRVRVVARRSRPMAVAGYVVTGLGLGVLAAGIGMAAQPPAPSFDGTEEQSNSTIPNDGKIIAGVGGMVTAVGAVLMALGLTQRREEVPAGRDDFHYLTPQPGDGGAH